MPGLSVLKTLSRSFLLWFGVVFCSVGLMAFYFAMVEWRTQRHFEEESVQTQATILSKSIEKASNDGNPRTKYLVTYHFPASNGRMIEKSSEVSVDQWEQLTEAASFTVRYLPSDPLQSDGPGESWEPFMLAGFGALFTAIGFLVARSDLRHVRLVHRVARTGLPAEGTVRKVWPTSTSINRVPQWQLSYEYRDHIGRTQQGESHLLSPDEAAEWHPGDNGAVCFDRERPQDSVWIGRHSA